MYTSVEIKKKLEKVFDEKRAMVLAEVISEAYNGLVKTSDFNELKGIVKELAEAQKRTEQKVGELAEAQKRTEIRVEELAEAQKETQREVSRLDRALQGLAEAQRRTEIEIQKLTKGLTETRGELGGLSRSMSYAFENEAYRMLPVVLKDKYGIEIKEKIVRAEIGGKEVNIFGRATQNGKEVFIVGEAKLRLDDIREKKKEADVFKELEDKVGAVIEEYGKVEIMRILVTHYATKGFLKESKGKGIIVVQSFEW